MAVYIQMFVMTLHQLQARVLDAFLIYLQFLLPSLEAVITRTFMSLWNMEPQTSTFIPWWESDC